MLKELYHGEISPSEKKPEPADHQTQEYLKLSAEFEKRSDTGTNSDVQRFKRYAKRKCSTG